MESDRQRDLLRPPRDCTLTAFLTWVANWRVIPMAAPPLRKELLTLLNRARGASLIRIADSFVGPVIGLSHSGSRRAGRSGASLAKISTRSASQRAALYLAALRLPERVKIIRITRHHLVLSTPEGERTLGWRTGDIAAGPLGAPVPLPIALPKQLDISDLDLTDLEWEKVYELFVRPPDQVVRSPYWARTLVDASLHLAKYGPKSLESAHSASLTFATYRFVHRRAGAWSRLAKKLSRHAVLASKLERMAGF